MSTRPTSSLHKKEHLPCTHGFSNLIMQVAGGPTRVENAKIALIQFCVSPPKTDMENSIVINDYTQMDRCACVPTGRGLAHGSNHMGCSHHSMHSRGLQWTRCVRAWAPSSPAAATACAGLSSPAQHAACSHMTLSKRRILKEERNHIIGLVKKIKASGANVLLVQKSILRDATTDLSLHFLVRSQNSAPL